MGLVKSLYSYLFRRETSDKPILMCIHICLENAKIRGARGTAKGSMQNIMQRHLGAAVPVVGVAILPNFAHQQHIRFEGFEASADSRSYREPTFDVILLRDYTEETDGGEYSHHRYPISIFWPVLSDSSAASMTLCTCSPSRKLGSDFASFRIVSTNDRGPTDIFEKNSMP